MRHFAHHIGDYAAATAHLSFVEDAAYHRLLRRYYQDERALPADLVATQRLVGARTKEERSAVEAVLGEFFVLGEDGWHQSRADKEIEAYRNRAETARQNGTNGGRPPKPKDNPGGTESVSAGKLTNNQEPRTKEKSASKGSRLPPDWKPTQEELDYAAEQGCSDPTDTAERFRLHHVSKGTIGKDWHAGFQYWCRNEKNFKSPAKTYVDKFAKPDVRMPSEEPWEQRVREFQKGYRWNTNDWGPPPGESGCRVPKHMITTGGTA